MSKVTIRWFPPSWLLIQALGEVIYIDPAWIYKNFDTYQKKVIFSHYPEPMDGLPEPDLPKADIILITHHHQDHIKTVTLSRLIKNSTRIFAPTKCAELIARPFETIKPDDEWEIGKIKIMAVYAYNTPEGKSTRKVHNYGECVGYLLTIGGKTIYHAGDTDIIPEMKNFGKIDLAFLPIGGTFTMNMQEALEAIKIIKPQKTVPIHFLKADPLKFQKMVKSTRVDILKVGESIII